MRTKLLSVQSAYGLVLAMALAMPVAATASGVGDSRSVLVNPGAHLSVVMPYSDRDVCLTQSPRDGSIAPWGNVPMGYCDTLTWCPAVIWVSSVVWGTPVAHCGSIIRGNNFLDRLKSGSAGKSVVWGSSASGLSVIWGATRKAAVDEALL